jgi:hypothetical protein
MHCWIKQNLSGRNQNVTRRCSVKSCSAEQLKDSIRALQPSTLHLQKLVSTCTSGQANIQTNNNIVEVVWYSIEATYYREMQFEVLLCLAA